MHNKIEQKFDPRISINAMHYAIDSGSYNSLMMMVCLHGWKILQSEDESIRKDFGAILKKLSTAHLYESRHGTGSLLKLNHPAVQQKIRLGLISEAEIAAAEAHSAL